MGSRSEKDLRSHKKLVRMGTAGGPGGSLGFVLEGEKRVKMDLRRVEMQRVTMMMNQVSMF